VLFNATPGQVAGDNAEIQAAITMPSFVTGSLGPDSLKP
jgi:hypothetical protein